MPPGNDAWHLAATHTQQVDEPVRVSTAVAFDVAGPPVRNRAPESFSDEGTRHEVRLDETGSVYLNDDRGPEDELLESATTRLRTRAGEAPDTPLRFSLLAANGGRVFAKERGALRFWLLAPEHLDVHRTPAGTVEPLPSSYFALDPEHGQKGAPGAALAAPLRAHAGPHPATERFSLLADVLEHSGGLGFQVVIVQPRVWHWLDTRPPLASLSPEGSNAPWWRPLLNLDPGLAFAASLFGLASGALPRRLRVADVAQALRSRLDAAANVLDAYELAPPPQQPPLPLEQIGDLSTVRVADFQRVDHRFRNGTPTWVTLQRHTHELEVKSVLAIGVGHAHRHEQWESRYGGELQPLRLRLPLAQNAPVNALSYRFFNGPVRDGDGFIDGTCNYYALCELAPSSGRRFGLLFADEQSFFSGRWRLVHPTADGHGLTFALITELARPEGAAAFGFEPRAFWSPFDDGCVDARSRLAASRQVLLVTGAHGGHDELYSINFSWSTCDRTWRWRRFPAPARFASPAAGATVVDEADVPADPATPDCVLPQTLHLREDMTLSVKGTKQVGGEIVAGRWFQRYLPADNVHVPRFVSAPGPGASARPATGYTHAWDFLPEAAFDLAASRLHFGVYAPVDSRCQFYRVELDDAAAETVRRVGDEHAQWDAPADALDLDTVRFNWQAPGGVIDLNDLTTGAGPLYAGHARLKLLDRGPLGWIAVHFDKREDDLEPFSDLPRPVTLTRHGGTEAISVVIGENTLTLDPPMVDCAEVTTGRAPDGTLTAQLVFHCPGPHDRVLVNVWRIRAAAWVDGAVVDLLDVTRDRCTWDPASETWHVTWAVKTERDATLLSQQGRHRAATSFWFEDVVGHVATPERLALPLLQGPAS